MHSLPSRSGTRSRYCNALDRSTDFRIEPAALEDDDIPSRCTDGDGRCEAGNASTDDDDLHTRLLGHDDNDVVCAVSAGR